LVVQKISQIPCNNKLDVKKCMDITSQFAQNEGISLLRIDGFDISCKNKTNLKKWAHFFDLLFNKNEVFSFKSIKFSFFIKKIFICWCDSFKETFQILLLYLNIYKNFSLSAAQKFLHLEKKEYTKYRTYVKMNFSLRFF